MNNNELNNQETGVFNVGNTPNNGLNNQTFTDDSLNNFGQASTNPTPSVDLSSQSLQTEPVDTIFANEQPQEVITPSVTQPVNNVAQNLNSSQPVNNVVEEPKVSEPAVEPKQKKSKGPVIVIIFLILIILGLAGYIVYDKFLSKDTKEPETKEEEKTTLKEVKDTALVEELRSGLIATDGGALVEGLYHNYKITSSDSSNKELLIFNILKYVEENKINIHETKSTIDTGVQQDIKATISKADITTYMQNKYNTNLDYTYKASKQYDEVGIIGYLDVLADDTNYYIASIPGGDGSYYLNTKLVKAEEDKDNIYIYDNAVYSIFAMDTRRSFDSLDIGDYIDNEKNEYISDKILIECLGDNTTTDPYDMKKSEKCPFSGNISDITPDSMSKHAFENMSDKLKTFKHTFKKQDGNYFWVSSEVVE